MRNLNPSRRDLYRPRGELLRFQATDTSLIYSTAQEIAGRFNVPMPRIVIGRFRPQYVDGTIYIPDNLSPDMALRVIAHEMAHHIHSYYGIPCGVPEAETFASMFEEAWVRMKHQGYSYPVVPCSVCGFKLLMYGRRVVCPRCGSVYVYRYPSPGLGKAFGLAILSGIGTYVLTSQLLKETGGRVDPALVSAVSSGLIGFLAGLVL